MWAASERAAEAPAPTSPTEGPQEPEDLVSSDEEEPWSLSRAWSSFTSPIAAFVRATQEEGDRGVEAVQSTVPAAVREARELIPRMQAINEERRSAAKRAADAAALRPPPPRIADAVPSQELLRPTRGLQYYPHDTGAAQPEPAWAKLTSPVGALLKKGGGEPAPQQSDEERREVSSHALNGPADGRRSYTPLLNLKGLRETPEDYEHPTSARALGLSLSLPPSQPVPPPLNRSSLSSLELAGAGAYVDWKRELVKLVEEGSKPPASLFARLEAAMHKMSDADLREEYRWFVQQYTDDASSDALKGGCRTPSRRPAHLARAPSRPPRPHATARARRAAPAPLLMFRPLSPRPQARAR